MIRFQHVHKSYRVASSDGRCRDPGLLRRRRRRVVLDDCCLEFPPGRSFGILGGNGAGKSTLIRLLAGVELPDRGRVLRGPGRRVSFPLGFSGTFHPYLSGRENVLFLARVYGADGRRTLRFVEEFSELGDYMRMPVATLSAGMRAKLAFGACLAIEFDVYLIDEVTAVGDARFQARCLEAFEARAGTADVVLVSHDLRTIRSYCDAGGVLADGRLTLFGDVEDAVATAAQAVRAVTAAAAARLPAARDDSVITAVRRSAEASA